MMVPSKLDAYKLVKMHYGGMLFIYYNPFVFLESFPCWEIMNVFFHCFSKYL